ncbi:MAG: hypothetical protein ACFFED_03150 [Candidatus Thorarchaeota archaeon]
MNYEQIQNYLNQIANDETVNIETDDRSIELRKPNGMDQCKWLQSEFKDIDSAKLEIIRTLAKENIDDLPKSMLATISKQLENIDPLMNLNLKLICPACGEEGVYFLDLETISLEILRETQRELFEGIHILAREYGWNESEILSLPSWRRKQYISMIERGASR